VSGKPGDPVGRRLGVTVVVAVRNEEKNIAYLLGDLKRQTYTPFEVVIVDDHSEDATRAIVQEHLQHPNMKLVSNTGAGKKAALTQGVQLAQGVVVITTDADCRVTPEWIATLMTYFARDSVQMVFGGVAITGGDYFSSLQSLEFASLIGSGAGTMALGIPTMCNGANLAFRKDAFEAVGGYEGNLHIPSGDDEFLLRKIAQHFPGGIAFSGDERTVVTTTPSQTLHDFIHQRIRWAGKWRHHQSFVSKGLALFVAAFQALVFLLPVMVVMQRIDAGVALGLWVGKAMLEYFFLRHVSHILRLSWNWPAFLSLQVLYPLYILSIGVFSNFHTFEWKGRKLKSLTISHNDVKHF
jgi:biofilm PGA synthesis N-glycosyltransferase PgaC